jgi:PAB1-binding protein PBP1
LYTTKINYNSLSKEVKETAARVEKEILHADSKGNVHLAEERQ